VQSDPNTQHVAAAMMAMECVVVQDIFLNETAKYAHVFLPGSSFLEKDGTFTNAERRISRVRKVMPPLAGYADWEVTQLLSNALGYPMHYSTREIMAEIAALTPSFAGVTYDKLDRLGSVQWPCNEARRGEGTPSCTWTICARQGRFIITQYVATDEKVTRRFPLLLTTGRILSQYNVGAQTRRTANTSGTAKTCWRSTRTTPRSAASRTATGSASRAARARRCCAPRSPSASSRAWSTPPSTSPNRAPT
jgi:formate dehydrogenase major subunit